MSENVKPDTTAGAPAAPKLPATPAKFDPVAAAEAHLSGVDMQAQREALKRLSRSL